jgi:nitroreductase
MDVTTAVLTRRSTRAFLPTPVSKAKIEGILEIARRSPSGSNVQPWFVHVVTNEPLAALLADVRTSISSSPKGEGTEFSIYPDNMGDPYRTRRYASGEAMYEKLGIERDNKFGRLMQFARNYQAFDAPVALFFSIDRAFGPGQWAHLGMFMQTFMLVAHEQGLASCAQESWAAVYVTVSRHLGLADNQMLYCGMSLGYGDPDALVNTLVTDRAEVADFVTFTGF